MATYNSFGYYILDAADLREKITRIDAVITKLEEMALLGADNMDITETSLDDGQTKIKTIYRSAAEIASTITKYMVIKNRYISELNGCRMSLIDSRNV